MDKIMKDMALASTLLTNTVGWIKNFDTPEELQEHANDDPRTKDCTLSEIMDYEEDDDLREFLGKIYDISTEYMAQQASKRI